MNVQVSALKRAAQHATAHQLSQESVKLTAEMRKAGTWNMFSQIGRYRAITPAQMKRTVVRSALARKR